MTIDEIVGIIDSDIDAAGTLILPGDAFNSAWMESAFSHYLTDDALMIAAAVVTTTSTQVVVTGKGLGRFANLATTATFTVTETGDFSLSVEGAAPSGWTFPLAFTSLAGGTYDSVFVEAGGLLAFNMPPEESGVTASMTFDGAVLADGLLANAPIFLDGETIIPIAGPIEVDDGVPQFDFSATGAQGLTVGTLTGLNFTLSLISTPYVASAVNADGTTTEAQTQNAYVALNSPLTFKAKGETLTVTASMPFSLGPLASLSVSVSGDIGVLLDDFVDWAGGSLFPGMPPADLFNPADYLALDNLSFLIGVADARLSSFNLTVSTTKDWTVIPGLITIAKVSQTLTSLGPASLSSIQGSLSGTVMLGDKGSVASIEINAGAPNFTLSGSLTPGTTVDCSALVTYLIPGALDIPQITLTYFEFLCQATNTNPTFSINACFETDWVLKVSPVSMAVTDAYVDLNYGPSEEGAFSTTGALGGTIVFDDTLSFSVSYSTPGAFEVIGRFDKISLLKSIARLVMDMPIPLPSGFDLDFTNCVATICYGTTGQSETLEFQISATVPGLGLVAFDALDVGGTWGYAAGVDMGDNSLASVPGLSALAPFVNYFKFKRIVLVVSSADLPNFVFAGEIPLPPGQAVVVGMNAYADIDLNSERELSLLMKFLNLQAELGITLQIGLEDVAAGSSLYATMNGVVNSNVAITGSFGAQLLAEMLTLFMTGTLSTTLQGEKIEFMFNMTFEENGAFLSGGYDGTLEFVIVKLSNLDVEIGVDWEGVPTIGFGAQIDVDEYESSVMILLDSINPAQSMFVASISDISLAVFLKTLCNLTDLSGVPPEIMGALEQTGLSGTNDFTLADSDDAVCDALNGRDIPTISAAFAAAGVKPPLPIDPLQVIVTVSKPNTLWFVTDLENVLHYRLQKSEAGQAIRGELEPQLYVVPQPTQLGSTIVQQGYRANATLDLFGFKSAVNVEIADQQGLSIDAEFSKIVIAFDNYPVFSLTSANGSTGPALSVCSYTNITSADVLKQNPHFFADGKVNVLGVITESVLVNFSGAGGYFEIDATVYGAASYSMKGGYSSLFDFSLEGSALVGVDQTFDFGVLGKVPVDCQVGYAYSVSVTSATSGSGSASGSFHLYGVDFTIGTFDLPLVADSLAALATEAADQVYAALETFFDLSEQWLDWVGKGIIEGVNDAYEVGQSLEAAYSLAYDAIATQTTDILHYSTDQVTSALQGAGATADETYEVLVNTLSVPAEEAAKTVEAFFTGTGEHVDEILIPGYNDNTLHIDNGGYNDNTLHVDNHGYNDNTLHVDTGGYNDNTLHIDNHGYNDNTLHVDNGGYNDRTVHVDNRGYNDHSIGIHIDTGHDDTGHIDTGHNDTGHIDTGGHNDTGHIDTGHDDTGHIDTGGHNDTGHIDTGHDDTGHIDTSPTHLDEKL